MIGAFFIGLFGSLHCVGMCGPVMVAFLGPHQSRLGFFLYHFGRILSYLIIGGMLGIMGASLVFFKFQQVMVLVLGVVLIVLYAIPSFRYKLERAYFESGFYQTLKGFLARNLSAQRRWFLSGMANGFFPCGLTYVAAAGAVALGNPVQGALFMTLFGLGTLPALVMVIFAGGRLFQKFRLFIPNTITFIAILSGSIMILRGLLTAFPDFNEIVQANAAGLITVCGL